MNTKPYTDIACQAHHRAFCLPTDSRYLFEARTPWQTLGKRIGSGFLFGADMVKEIPLTRGMVALVDDDDYEELNKYKWYASKGRNTFYAKRSTGGFPKTISMHRDLISTKGSDKIDHRNGNGIDNRRFNLRACTNSQNCANKIFSQNNPTGFRGVHKRNCKRLKPYSAQICVNCKDIHVGSFFTAEEAARAYDAAAIEYFGEFAVLNFPIRAAWESEK